jgi:hypothetical protein
MDEIYSLSKAFSLHAYLSSICPKYKIDIEKKIIVYVDRQWKKRIFYHAFDYVTPETYKYWCFFRDDSMKPLFLITGQRKKNGNVDQVNEFILYLENGLPFEVIHRAAKKLNENITISGYEESTIKPEVMWDVFSKRIELYL